MKRCHNSARRLRSGAMLLLGVLAGCSSIGPTRLLEDRLDYARVIADAGKRQTLYNIVRLRFGEPPTFLALNQVVSSYALQASAGVGGEFHPAESASSVSFWAPNIRGDFADRPTFTLTPVTGDDFVKAYLRPLPPGVLLRLVDAGAPIDTILRMFAFSIGGLRNTHALAGDYQAGSPEFLPVLASLRRLQDAGALRVREEGPGAGRRAYISIDLSEAPSLRGVADDVFRRLRLDPAAQEIAVVYGHRAQFPSRRVIPVRTRTLFGALLAVAVSIELPNEDIRADRALPTVHAPGNPRPAIVIRSGSRPPTRSYVSIDTNGRWFWVEDNDIDSKVAFTILELLKAIAESSRNQATPTLTIPAG